MERIEAKDHDAKIRFSTKAVAETAWFLMLNNQVQSEPSFQFRTDALYTAMGKLRTFWKESAYNKTYEMKDTFKILMWKQVNDQRNQNSVPTSEKIMAQFSQSIISD